MGEDWIRKTDRAFVASMKRHLGGVIPPPLLVKDEEELLTFHCQLLPDQHVVTGEHLAVFLRAEHARIAVVRLMHVIAYVDGESETDLRKLLVKSKMVGMPVDVVVVSAMQGESFFEVVLVGSRRRGKVR